MRLRCKNCQLEQLPGFIGQAYCRFHWAGRLQHLPNGEVPKDMLNDYRNAKVAVPTSTIVDMAI